METLRISEVFTISGRGTAVFFEKDPVPWWRPLRPHVVRITNPDGHQITATADVEFARKIPPGEVMSLVFPDLMPEQVPVGSRVECISVEP